MRALNNVGEYIIIDIDMDLDSDDTEQLFDLAINSTSDVSAYKAVHYKDGDVFDQLGGIFATTMDEVFEALMNYDFPVDRVPVLQA